MSRRDNIPVILQNEKKTLMGIITNFERNSFSGYFFKNGIYVKQTFPKDTQFVIDRNIFREVELFAKIVSYKKSAQVFGMEQRKADFLNAVLRVINYSTNRKIDDDHYSLQTNRRDGAILEFLRSDLEFIYPTLYDDDNINTNRIKKGSDVVAIRDDKCMLFRKGDSFKVIDVSLNDDKYGNNVLILRNGMKEIISYTKYFKLRKDERKL